MKHDNFYESTLFNEFAQILEKQGQLKKTATYVFPADQIIGQAVPDLIEMDFSKLAQDGRSGVYDIGLDESNEAMAARAHPGGGQVVEKAVDITTPIVKKTVEQAKRLKEGEVFFFDRKTQSITTKIKPKIKEIAIGQMDKALRLKPNDIKRIKKPNVA